MHVQLSFLVVAASLSFATAHAEPIDDPSPPAAPIDDGPGPRGWFGPRHPHACACDERGDWSLGTSLTFAGGTLGGIGLLGGLGGLGALGIVEVGIEPGVTLERRLDDHWWLTVGASFGYRDNDAGMTTLGGAGSLGARFVIDPTSRVHIAPHMNVYAGGGSTEYASTTDGTTTTLAFDSRHFGVALGLDVELAVVDGFALRLDITLAQADWSIADRTEDTSTDHTLGVGVAMLTRPTLSAVFMF